MKSFKIMVAAAMTAGSLSFLTSCDHKDLCWDHEGHALRYKVDIQAEYSRVWEWTQPGETDWKATWPKDFGFAYDSLTPGLPKGLRATVYYGEGNSNINNLPTMGGEIALANGENDILFYNNDTEYIVFSDMGDVATAMATTRTRTRPSYKGSPMLIPSRSDQDATVAMPDMLYGSSLLGYVPQKTLAPVPIKISMTPLVFTYYVRCEFKHGIQYVALARGAMAGMAAGVSIYSGQTTNERATVIFDCDIEGFGTQAFVRTFGVPDFPNDHYGSRGDKTYGLNIEVRLKNGKIKSFDIDITDQMRRQPQGGVIIARGLEVTDEEGMQGGEGFQVDVEDWGEFEDVPLDL